DLHVDPFVPPRIGCQPVDLPEVRARASQGRTRAHDDPAPRRIELHHVERLSARDSGPAALADGEMDYAFMPAEHAAIDMMNLAGFGSAGPQTLHHAGITALRHEADILAVGLRRDGESELIGQRAGLCLGQLT